MIEVMPVGKVEASKDTVLSTTDGVYLTLADSARSSGVLLHPAVLLAKQVHTATKSTSFPLKLTRETVLLLLGDPPKRLFLLLTFWKCLSSTLAVQVSTVADQGILPRLEGES